MLFPAIHSLNYLAGRGKMSLASIEPTRPTTLLERIPLPPTVSGAMLRLVRETSVRSKRMSPVKKAARVIAEGAKDFFSAPVGRLKGKLRKAVRDEEDMFWLLAFPELLGIPSPASYYNLELLALLAGEMEDWTIRMEHPGLRSDRLFRSHGLI